MPYERAAGGYMAARKASKKVINFFVVGLTYGWQRTWLEIAGTCGLLGAAITFHAIYNLLIAYGGAAQYIAYLLPVLILAAGKLIFRSSIQ